MILSSHHKCLKEDLCWVSRSGCVRQTLGGGPVAAPGQGTGMGLSVIICDYLSGAIRGMHANAGLGGVRFFLAGLQDGFAS